MVHFYALCVILLNVAPLSSEECNLSSPTLIRELPGRVISLNCEDNSQYANTTAQCVLQCLSQQNCTLAITNCTDGPCQCSLCQGVENIETNASTNPQLEFYLIGRVLAANVTFDKRLTRPLPSPVVEGQLFRYVFTMPTKKIVMKLKDNNQILVLIEFRVWSSTIVRNSVIKNQWGKAEYDIPYYDFPEGTEMDVIVLVRSTEYKVYVNSVPFFTFEHREPDLSGIDSYESDVGEGFYGQIEYLFVSTWGN